MTNIRAIMANYKEVRNRLRWPPNAVPDTGINLRRKPAPAAPEPLIVLAPPPIPIVPDRPSFIPFRRTDLTFASTLRFVAQEFDLTDTAIRSRRRTHDICIPRQIAVYLAAKNRLQSLAGMGRYLKMDHTTMINARDKITSLMASDDTLRDRILALETRILAAFDRLAVPAQRQPYLDTEKTEGPAAVGEIPRVDTGS